MEDDRKTIEKRMFLAAIPYILILAIIIVFLFILTHNTNVIFLLLSIPIPLTFFSKNLIKKYSRKYKETVIKYLFLSYFDNFEIDPERKSQILDIKKAGFFSLKRKIQIDAEDFITLTYRGNKILMQEILLKQGNEVAFKGVLCSMDLKPIVNQNFIITHQTNKYVYKYFVVDDFKILKINDINVLYQGAFDQEISRPFIEIVNNNQISLSILDGKLHCLFPSDMDIDFDKMEMFEPMLTSECNSSDTYSFIQNQYYRISNISRLLLKLEEINVA